MEYKNKNILIFSFGIIMFTSLMYEVIWTRYLSVIFGTAFYALSSVLASFMLGLGLGSYYLSKKLEKLGNLNKVMSKLLVYLGIYSLFLLIIFKLLGYIYIILFNLFKDSFLIIFFVFLFVLIILMPPTLIIGACFPIINKMFVKDLKTDISDIYAIDTIFAGFGALLTGFIFIPFFGLWQTVLLGSILNFISAYIFFVEGELIK